ncbi:alpha-2-macroglobulin family protein [Pendulispora albinea]|uniref:MG2 domain-containing protein n=1 Tax=Pendulispora albinea TaxID=2741071 RepID=A0ABZ2M4Z5_9BACT
MYARLALVVCLAFVVLGCPGESKVPSSPGKSDRPVASWKPSKSGAGFRLSNAEASEDRVATPAAKSDPLSEADTRKVLDRLPKLAALPDDAKDFALRAGTMPAPRTGKTVSEPFPPPAPPAAAPQVASGPLRVLRHAPEGAVDLASHLEVTFSAPMVPITSQGELAAANPPVRITPQPPGTWRWVGTQTLLFEPASRAKPKPGEDDGSRPSAGAFPMATDYEVEIPAGTRAANGATLAAAERWKFSTPAPKVTASYPSSPPPTRFDPLLFVAFNQAIDPQAVLKSIELAGNPRPVGVRLATSEEVDADRELAQRVKDAMPGRWLALRPSERLAPDAAITVKVKAGAPSLEGPKRTPQDQTFAFRTHGALRITEHRCGWDKTCRPGMPFRIELSNSLDPARFDKNVVRVEPPIAQVKVGTSGGTITISGRTRGKTTYKVTVGAGLRDEFEQTLGRDETVSFTTDRSEPMLFPEQEEMTVLEPSSGGKLPVYSVNHTSLSVQLYAVRPDDWAKYIQWRGAWDRDRQKKMPVGKLVASRTVTPANKPDDLTETLIDLAPALSGGLGQVVVVVEPTGAPPPHRSKPTLRTWVQATNMALTTTSDAQELVTLTTALATGAPLAGVDVSLVSGGAAVKTGADGLARTSLGTASVGVVARKGNDLAFLPARYGSSFRGLESKDMVRWFVFDDRRTYKPGEEVRVKGWVRRAGMGKGGDIAFVDGATHVDWAVRDARGNEFKKGVAPLDKTGGLDLAFKIPDSVNLGHASVRLSLQGARGVENVEAHHGFVVQEFRRPEFEVSAQASEGPHFVGDHAVTTMTAAYYAGGGLANTEVNWSVTRQDAVFNPPNRADYIFGRAPEFPWLRGGGGDVVGWGGGGRGGRFHPEPPFPTETWKGVTDRDGKHRLRIDFDPVDPSYPMELRVESSVQDVNRQTFAGSTNILVHPGTVYVGIRRPRSFVRAGQVIEAQTLATDIDGRAVRGRPVTVTSARLDWEQQGTEYVEVDKDVRSCTVTSGEDAVSCSLPTTVGGRYRVTAVVTDPQGRRNQSETVLWVVGDTHPADKGVAEESITLVPDKDEYQPGDVAEVLIVSPFSPGEAVVSVGRQGILNVQRVTLSKPSATVRIPIDASFTPNVYARVQIAGLAPRKNGMGEIDPRLAKRPAYAEETVLLKVAPRDRKLTIAVKPRASKLEPGGSTVVDLDVRDAKDRPAPGSDLTVVVVDEAILALSDYKLPNPLEVFYAPRGEGVSGLSSLGFVLLGEGKEKVRDAAEAVFDNAKGGAALERMPVPVAEPAPPAPPPPPGMAQGRLAGQAGADAIAVRTDFTPLAAFFPRVTTDAAGRASVTVKLPDSLTRYRVMAIAAEGATRFGAGESTITARLPLMVRPSAPRFLNFGDRFELPIVLQNQTDQAMTVDVAARGTNADVSGTGKRVSVPANDRVEVRLLAAARRAGTARFQVGAASGRWADASQIELPVWTPATTEAFATYGQIDQGAIAQPVKVPGGIVKEYGSLSVSTSSTALQALTDAVIYLVGYPFECNEQIASRVVAIASLKDVLAAFQVKDLPPPAQLVETVQRDLERLRRFQHQDGGWSFWTNEGEVWPYLSIHVAHALVRAKDKGFAVDKGMLERSQNYLRTIAARIPAGYSTEARRELTAYALFVRHLMGDSDRAAARRLIAEAGGAAKLHIEANGWLLRVLTGDAGSQAEVAAIRRALENRVTETAGAAHFVAQYEDGAHLLLASDRRADAVILESLIVDQPKSDLIAKIVAGLLAHRTAGHWASTQENAFVLIALDRYFRAYEGTTPDFVARAWLGDKLASEHTFRGRSTDRASTDIPMQTLAALGSDPSAAKVTLAKDGPGRLYFRIGMTYAPADLKPPPVDHGFTVSRTYEAVDRPEDVRRDPDGTVHVKAGARVRVRLNMVAPTRRYHVALVDSLPAGLEPLNAALAVTESIPSDPKEVASRGPLWFWLRTWVEHQNMRDNRVEAFASLVWEGVHPYTYVARATTPGTFVVPPPKAEEMYNPETFGRGPGDRLIVE